MTDQPDEPLDFTPVLAELDRRADRLSREVMGRVAQARLGDALPGSMAEQVRQRIARAAFPLAFAAAASLALLAIPGRSPEPAPARVFAAVVLEGREVGRWIMLEQGPSMRDLLPAPGARR